MGFPDEHGDPSELFYPNIQEVECEECGDTFEAEGDYTPATREQPAEFDTEEKLCDFCTEQEEEREAKAKELLAFANSSRGQLIISQALHIAIEVMEEIKPEHLKERSNIADMKLLYENVFPLYGVIKRMEEKLGAAPDFIYDATAGDTLVPDNNKKENDDAE